MKSKVLFLVLAVFLLNANLVFGLIIIEDGYTPGLTLQDDETLLMTGGGVGNLNLEEFSSATIRGTSTLEQGYGGIWQLSQVGCSTLDFSGGEINQFSIHTYATAFFSGGSINYINSYQIAWIQEGDPPVWVPNPHITIDCQLDTIFHDTQTNLLTGNWLDGSSFSIQLVDIDGYSPAIENILFIPEPATLLLFTLGAVLIRKR